MTHTVTYAVLAACMTAGILAAAPSAETGPAHIARDGADVVLSWQSGLRMVSARLAPLPGWSIGQAACCIAGTNALFAAWEEISTNGTDTDLYVQHFGADGAPQWMPRGVVAIKFPGHQRRPAVTADGHGAYVAWQSDSAGARNNNIWCQRIEPDGRAAWATPAPVCTAPGDQTHAAIAIEPDGQVIIAWEDRRAGNADVYGQRIDPDGAPVGPEDGWAIEIAPGDQADVQFSCDASGAARAIRWRDGRGTSTPVFVETDLARLPIPEPAFLPLAAWFIARALARHRRVQ